jgi:hypothetical protein
MAKASRQRLIGKIPLEELWNCHEVRSAARKCYLTKSEVIARTESGVTTTMLASIGSIPIWKSYHRSDEEFTRQIEPHLVENSDRFYLDNFPQGMAYLASMWQLESGEEILVLEANH